MKTFSHFKKRISCLGTNQKIQIRFGDIVKGGPLAGIKLPSEAFREHISPYVLGSYELELAPEWDIVFKNGYNKIVNIGSIFGYFLYDVK